MDLSIVLPVYNERDNLEKLKERLVSVLEGLKNYDEWEIIFVDDGSTDGSTKVLGKFSEEDDRIRSIIFQKNFGQSPALQAGFDKAEGEVIVTLDSDLQNPPEEIPKLLKKMEEENLDVVSGWRFDREDSFVKKALSKFSNWLARKLTGVELHDFGCTLKAYSKESLEKVRLYGETHRYIPALISWRGYNIGELKVEHAERKHGETKYSNKRLVKGLSDLLNIWFWKKYSNRPVHIFGGLGLMLFFLGLVMGIYTLYLWVVYAIDLSDNFMAIASFLSIILGVQFFVSGIMLDVGIKNYYSNRREDIYEIKEIYNEVGE